ncbi:MAG: hypothetical protein GY754_01335 [bacterium]|nr:hypothetical protein [bacterium]
MLEVIALIIISGMISDRARAKGHVATGRYVLLFLFLFFACYFTGIVLGSYIYYGAIVMGSFVPGGSTAAGVSIMPYFMGINGAIGGTVLSFIIVGSLKVKPIAQEYNEEISVALPFEVAVWKEKIIVLILITAITVFFMLYFSYWFGIVYILAMLLSKVFVYTIIFDEEKIVFKYIYGRKRVIPRDQVVRAVLNKKYKIEIHWKKSSKHSTRMIKFSSRDFLMQQIPVENINRFLSSTYK